MYPYTEQLLALSRQQATHPCKLPPHLCDIVTPLSLTAWAQSLHSHPDKGFTNFVIAGLANGFRIGFNPALVSLGSAHSNMRSALDHPQTVSEYLSGEKATGRIGTLPTPISPLQISPFGVIPKKSKPGKWRLIIDLSSPEGHSVNDGIEKALCSISYVKIDQVEKAVLSLPPGALMAKIDVKHAYRNVPVHPDDRHLLAMQWDGEILVDKVLPFGLRSAPFIFTVIADALQWIIEQNGAQPIFHYLDDYITVGPPDSPQCRNNLTIIKTTCKNLGVPLEESKSEGPTPCITFLGLELDSIARIIRLPDDKLARLCQSLQEWGNIKATRKRNLLSLISHLQHAAKVVRQGRSFLRRLIDLASMVNHLDGFIRLNIPARSDIMWWRTFAKHWNGTSMLYEDRLHHPHIHVFSDASGLWGCAAFSGKTWFQYKWPSEKSGWHIAAKEMTPIVIAALLWGKDWQGLSVRFHSDNMAVVALLNSGAVKDNSLMHLMRCLTFVAAKCNFIFSSVHIRGTDNVRADALSRNNAPLFLSLSPQAQTSPIVIPSAITDLLVNTQPDWTSTDWLWNTIFTNQ